VLICCTLSERQAQGEKKSMNVNASSTWWLLVQLERERVRHCFGKGNAGSWGHWPRTEGRMYFVGSEKTLHDSWRGTAIGFQFTIICVVSFGH